MTKSGEPATRVVVTLTSAYRYQISLRVRHPSVDPQEITAALALQPSFAHRIGDERRSPKGKLLGGRWRKSYWTKRLEEGKCPAEKLSVAMIRIARQLDSHRTFFHRMRSEGGAAELFIGWFIAGFMAGDVFSCEVMTHLGDLKVDLSLDLYSGFDEDRRPLNDFV